MISIEGPSILVETATVTARFEDGFLVSLRGRATDRDVLVPFDRSGLAALELIYGAGPGVAFTESKPLTVTPVAVSDHCAEVRFHGWDADGVLRVSECLVTGDVLVEPSAYSSRPGVRACRWNLYGVDPEQQLVAPVYQGIRLPLSDPLIQGARWSWPLLWEAGFAVMQGHDGGFWVHAEDTAYRYKALGVGVAGAPQSLSFDTESYGPLDTNLGSGGLVWRLNTHQGDWRVPAGLYRDWLWQAYNLAPREAQRPDWFEKITFAVSWCAGDPDLLDALATQVPPERTLIHLPQWRCFGYDENYPDFTPSDAARAFVAKGKSMGFHVLPHCNAIDMDPTHPAYAYLQDFAYRDLVHRGLLGWGYESGKGVLSVPNSRASLRENRQRKVMVKIHPGLSIWRSILGEEIRASLGQLGTDAVFIDVTLCSFNIHNALVENMSTTEGMRRLIDHIASLNNGLVVAGEGLNEITMQGLSFAQAHLFNSHQATCPGLERAGGCPVNAFLFDKLCRTFGYSGLSGRTAEEQLRSRVHVSLGAIPTITGLGPAEVRNPSPTVKSLFEMANAS